MKFPVRSMVILLLLIFMIIWWGFIFFTSANSDHRYLYAIGEGVFPLIAGMIGFITLRRLGGPRSRVGLSVMFLSLGTVAWAMGQLTFAFYNIVSNIEVPYPSLADAGFVGGLFLWSLGIFLFSNVIGFTFRQKSWIVRLLIIILPITILMFSSYFLIVVARQNSLDFQSGLLKLITDFTYIIGDSIMLSITLFAGGLSLRYLQGFLRTSIITVMLGIFLIYISDFFYTYYTTTGAYYSGHWVDVLYPVSIGLLSIGVNNLEAT